MAFLLVPRVPAVDAYPVSGLLAWRTVKAASPLVKGRGCRRWVRRARRPPPPRALLRCRWRRRGGRLPRCLRPKKATCRSSSGFRFRCGPPRVILTGESGAAGSRNCWNCWGKPGRGEKTKGHRRPPRRRRAPCSGGRAVNPWGWGQTGRSPRRRWGAGLRRTLGGAPRRRRGAGLRRPASKGG